MAVFSIVASIILAGAVIALAISRVYSQKKLQDAVVKLKRADKNLERADSKFYRFLDMLSEAIAEIERKKSPLDTEPESWSVTEIYHGTAVVGSPGCTYHSTQRSVSWARRGTLGFSSVFQEGPEIDWYDEWLEDDSRKVVSWAQRSALGLSSVFQKGPQADWHDGWTENNLRRHELTVY